jgi:hypothetical protein
MKRVGLAGAGALGALAVLVACGAGAGEPAPDEASRERDRSGPDAQALHRRGVLLVRPPVGGFSDGGTYALSLGVGNGEPFRAIIAFSPGYTAATRLSGLATRPTRSSSSAFARPASQPSWSGRTGSSGAPPSTSRSSSARQPPSRTRRWAPAPSGGPCSTACDSSLVECVDRP